MSHMPSVESSPAGLPMVAEATPPEVTRRELLGTALKAGVVIVTAATLETALPESARADTALDPEPDNGPIRAPKERRTPAIEIATPKASSQQKVAPSPANNSAAASKELSASSGWVEDIRNTYGPFGLAVVGLSAVVKVVHNRTLGLRIREEDSYRETIKVIGTALATANPDIPSSYELVYHARLGLRRFARKKPFRSDVFDVAVGSLRSRSKAIDGLNPVQIENRLNADREALTLLSLANRRGRRIWGRQKLLDAKGISVVGMRFVRHPLPGLDLEGSDFTGRIDPATGEFRPILVTANLRGSRFKLAKLAKVIFGEDDEACDLRRVDFSKASMKGAYLRNVIIDEETQFCDGTVGDPRVTFGRVTSKTLSDERIQEKLREAQEVINQYIRDHPEPEEAPAEIIVPAPASRPTLQQRLRDARAALLGR